MYFLLSAPYSNSMISICKSWYLVREIITPFPNALCLNLYPWEEASIIRVFVFFISQL